VDSAEEARQAREPVDGIQLQLSPTIAIGRRQQENAGDSGDPLALLPRTTNFAYDYAVEQEHVNPLPGAGALPAHQAPSKGPPPAYESPNYADPPPYRPPI
jgi:hypothetical protein